jgi:prefoldin subunit 5
MPGWQRAAPRHPAYGDGVYSEPTIDEEKEILKNEAEALKKDLQEIQDHIEALEKSQKER